jgi:HK97 family phage portal protein
MNVKEWIVTRLGGVSANRLPALINTAISNSPLFFGMNNGVTLYPLGDEKTQIEKGYNKNAWVYSIVSKCAKKFGQVPFYHYRIKTKERKTWAEYQQLTKDYLQDPIARMEAKRMRTKAVDQVVVDSDLSKLLNKPNTNQSGSQFREQLYGYKLLTGEGNIWFSRMDPSARPEAMYIIPKSNLAIVKGATPWSIANYKLLLEGKEYENPKENILMWKFPNYDFDAYTLSHLRGMAPLNAGALLLQASNEGQERLLTMNKNQGVAGAAFRKDKHDTPSIQQAMATRQQFNSIVNDKDLAGTIAYLTGDYGFLQFGLDANQLKLLEQSDVHFRGLCQIYDVPWQLFGNADSYENRKQYKRDFVYDNIAVAAYSLRDEYNAKLIPEYNLDRERDVIDCDVMALPELSTDLKEQVATLEKAYGLTIDQRLVAMGYDPIGGEEGKAILIPAGMTTLSDTVAPIGDPLPLND